MSNRIVAIAAAAALATYAAASVSAIGTASAQELDSRGAVYGAKTVGALHYEAKGLPASAPVGAASAATVRWIAAPAETASVYGVGTVGALTRETKGLATSADAVVRQGGAATAATVRWTGPQKG